MKDIDLVKLVCIYVIGNAIKFFFFSSPKHGIYFSVLKPNYVVTQSSQNYIDIK